MGRKSQRLGTGLSLEERQVNPKGNENSMDAIDLQKLINKEVLMYHRLIKRMKIGRVGV